MSEDTPRTHRLRNWAFLIGLTLFLLGLDQLTKWLVRQNLAVNEAWAPIPALARFFTITHVRNTGVAFGQLAGFGWVFMLVPVVVLVAVLIYYPRIPDKAWTLRVAAALILTGGLGNLIDRLRTAFLYAQDTGSLWAALPFVYVTDFFDIKIWPVWNIADMCVVSGTIILGIWLWRSDQEVPETGADAVTTDP